MKTSKKLFSNPRQTACTCSKRWCLHFPRDEDKLKELDETVCAMLTKLSRKYPQMCEKYLEEMEGIIKWAQKELKRIK